MFSRFSQRMFHARGSNEESPSRGSTSSHAPSAKKPCNRPGDDDIQKRDSKSCEVDNSDKLVAKIAALYAERLMSDVTLVINGVDFPAHRLILCASSDVFQVMLMNPNWSESQKKTIQLVESVECARSFEDFLKYLYTGSLKLTLSNVINLLTLADKYNVKDLINLCLNYMIEHIPSAANHNQLIQWYQYTANCAHDAVAVKCRDFIKWNFESLARGSDFHHLDLELLQSILLDDDVVIYDEFSLFSCIEQWLTCQRSKLQQNGDPDFDDKMLSMVQEILACIRFPLMSPRQLADLLLCPITQQYKEYLMDKMAIAMRYHVSNGVTGSLLDLVDSHPNKSKFFTPRLYMTDQWSICMTVDNFKEMAHFQSKTLVFSTPISFAERAYDRQVEWVVDFYPKGVCFPKHYLIVWQGTVEVPEHVMQTVRLSVSCKNEEESDVRVQIGILIAGSQDGVDHIHKCVRRNYIFTKNDRVLNFDDLLPYGDLIRCANCNLNRDNTNENLPRMPPTFSPSPCTSSTSSDSPHGNNKSTRNPYCSSCTVCGSGKSCYLVGENHNALRVKIVITPRSDYEL